MNGPKSTVDFREDEEEPQNDEDDEEAAAAKDASRKV